VATPGRLLDHVQNRTVTFGQVSVLTLDEADRMLDMGFLPDIRRIIALLPARRQNLLFSATFPNEIRKLAATLLTNPAEIQIAARNAAAELVTHVVYPVAREKKRELLCHLIRTRNLTQVLVFSGTRIGANRLAHQLRREHIHADAIHGDKSQAERLEALEGFKAGRTAVLVATDVASRGLDIEGLPQVINFDIPYSPEDYVHRIGRTGRAGLAGEAISLVAPEDRESLGAIEKLIGRSIEQVLVPGFEPNAGTVAAVMGRSGRSDARGRGDARGRADGRTRSAARRPSVTSQAAATPRPASATPRPAEAGDPIFHKPYEPGSGHASEAPRQAGPTSARRTKQVAVLLGGARPSKG
jgi:ATP-dependent RNA helicase RhlE